MNCIFDPHSNCIDNEKNIFFRTSSTNTRIFMKLQLDNIQMQDIKKTL